MSAESAESAAWCEADVPGLRLVVAATLAAAIGLGIERVRTGAASAGAGPLPAVTIDLNRADAASLTLLPGIGPALAERIVDDRNRRGSFPAVVDLERVDGVGPLTVERVAPFARPR